MKLVPRLSAVAATAALVTGGVAVATAGPAAAADDQPCARPQVYKASHWVQYCPLWRANVPVYASPDQGNGAAVVGYLVSGGSANWFVGDRYRSYYSSGSYYNHWWAYTLADNGRWGVDGLALAQTAEVLGVHRGTVARARGRALRKLRGELARHDDERRGGDW
jgi:hypothetical protein